MQGLKAKMQNIMHPGSATGTGTGATGPIGDKAQIRYGRLQLVEAASLPKDLQGTRFHPYIATYLNGHLWTKSRTIKPDVAGMTNIMINDVSDCHITSGNVNDEVEIRLYDDNLIKDTCVATGKLPLRNLYGAPFLVPLHPASDRFRPLGSFGGGATTGVGGGVILGQAEIQLVGADRLFMGAGTAPLGAGMGSGVGATGTGTGMGTGVGAPGMGVGSGVGAAGMGAGMGAAGMGAAGMGGGMGSAPYASGAPVSSGMGSGMGGAPYASGAPVAGGMGSGSGMGSGLGTGAPVPSAAPVAVATTAPGGIQSGGLQSGGLQSGGLQSGGLQSGGLQQSSGVSGAAPSIVAASKASAGVGSVPVGGQPAQLGVAGSGSNIGGRVPEAR